jgi:hypothetical protein
LGKGVRDSGETLIGARVVGGGGIGACDSLAIVVGSSAGGDCGSIVGVIAVWTAVVSTVAGATGTGGAVTAVVAVVDGGVESLGVTIGCAGWAGCSSTMTVAVGDPKCC